MKIRWINLLLILCSVILVDRFCASQTKFRFSKASTHYCYPFDATISSEIPSCLNQPFYFLGSGVQCYAFVGEDQKTILKLFKHHHMGLSTDQIKKLMPHSSIMKKRERRMVRYFKSAQIAHDLLSEETGVFYTHLGKTHELLGTTLLYDRLGRSHVLDLDQTEFVLQKRAEPVESRLATLFKENKADEAFVAMSRLLTMIEERSKKGIKNKDPRVTVNCGFDGNQPMEMDIGSFAVRTPSSDPQPDQTARMKGAMQLLRWVKKHHPEYLYECRRRILDENLL